MRIQPILLLALMMIFCDQSSAERLDFEATSDSPNSDNSVFPPGELAGVSYRFGVDIDDDGTLDSLARLERRGDDPINAYTLGSLADDGDEDDESDGGEWLLRRPKVTEEGSANNLDTTFLWELNSGTHSFASIGGEIWDVDLGEEFRVLLQNQSREVIEDLRIPIGSSDGRGRATSFQFNELDSANSLVLSIQLLSSGDSAGGYGIDNMQFTLVPEPQTASCWVWFTIAMLQSGRARGHSCRRRTSAARILP